jgi:hypothetical protein
MFVASFWGVIVEFTGRVCCSVSWGSLGVFQESVGGPLEDLFEGLLGLFQESVGGLLEAECGEYIKNH